MPTILNSSTLGYIYNLHNKYRINSKHNIHNKKLILTQGLKCMFRFTMNKKYNEYDAV